jgi:hypothetical protein
MCVSTLESVGFLQSFIGGSIDSFGIVPLSDIVFTFSLSCKAVGFAVYNIGSYKCKSLKAYLHLWNFGGPNWIRELQFFNEEESTSWKLVSRKRSPSFSYADVVRSSILSWANAIPMGKPRFNQFVTKNFHPKESVLGRL